MKTKSRKIWLDLLCIGASLFVVFAVACLRYGLTEPAAWQIPFVYQDDALYSLALFTAVSRMECIPYTSFIVSSLGAPFSGNWNDFPVTGPGLLLFCGLASKCFGSGLASNAALVLAHFTTGIAMYLCLRVVGSARLWALVFSICLGLSPFLFGRGLTHIVLTFSYSVPVALALGLLVYRNGSCFLSGWRLVAVLAISFYFGGIFPYYTAFFLIIMAFAGLYCLMNERKIYSVVPFVLIAVAAFAHFFLLTEPFRQYARENGPNEFAVSRFYANLQVCALRPVELFLPGSGSRIPVLKQLSAFYENQDIFRNKFGSSESMAAYMGLPAIAGFTLLACMTLYFIFTRRQQMISGWFWVVAFFMSFAVVGGLNGFLGFGKFFLLRSSNRVSIYIVAACLFFLALLLTRWQKKIPLLLQICVAVLMVGLAVLEALPTGESLRAYNERIMNSDREMVSKLEADLPRGAMVFNYPVIDFPESGTYAFLRPYLFSEDLRFSSGSVKGRARESWQHEVEKLPAGEMLDELQRLGFSGILVYQGSELPEELKEKSYQLLEALQSLPNARIESGAGDFVFIRLQPSGNPELPTILPQFLSTWWPSEVQPVDPDLPQMPEGTRWCAQRTGEVEIFNELPYPKKTTMHLKLLSMDDANIEISMDGKPIKSFGVKANLVESLIIDLPELAPGASWLSFQTNSQPVFNGGRKFGFALCLVGP